MFVIFEFSGRERSAMQIYDCFDTRTMGPVGAAVVPSGSRVTAKVSTWA